MNITIVDDSVDDRRKLQEYLDKFFLGSLMNVNVKTYCSGEEYLSCSNTQGADVVFLDIFMKDMTGVDVARRIRESGNKCAIVFVTSANNFAQESYEVDALHYLIKPYEYDKFAQVMKKVDDRMSKSVCYIDFKQKTEVKRIMLPQIIFVDYYNHYVQVHTQSEVIKSYVVTFAEVSETLLKYKNFLWCYRNVLVNMDKVDKIEGKNFFMSNGEIIPINRDKAKDIKQQYNDYLFKKIEGAF